MKIELRSEYPCIFKTLIVKFSYLQKFLNRNIFRISLDVISSENIFHDLFKDLKISKFYAFRDKYQINPAFILVELLLIQQNIKVDLDKILLILC